MCVRENEIEALTEGRRRRREKLDPSLNSIEGERSQFGLAAEGSWKQFVRSGAKISFLSRISAGMDGCGCGCGSPQSIRQLLHGQTGGERQQMAVRLAFDPVREMAEQIWASEIRRRVQTLKKERFELR